MGKIGKLTLFVLASGLLILVFISCGEDKGAGIGCINCEFWHMPFGGIGRFPAVSPDGRSIAFSSTRGSTEEDPIHHIWLAELAGPGDTTRFYPITSGAHDDFRPAWSPDGRTIVFERNLGWKEYDIFAADVTNPAEPGEPQQITDRASLPESNMNPSWITKGGDTWVMFSNAQAKGNDYDIFAIRYPDLDSIMTISHDPADYAQYQNDVLSAVFKDRNPSGSGGSYVTFSSPDRVPVCDLRVVATSEELQDTSFVRAAVYINDVASGDTTPAFFHYRPASEVIRVAGERSGYCSRAEMTILPEPFITNTVLLSFTHQYGTLGLRTNYGSPLYIMIGDTTTIIRGNTVVDTIIYEKQDVETSADSLEYAFVRCLEPGWHLVYLENIYGTSLSDTVSFKIVAGEITTLFLDIKNLGWYAEGDGIHGTACSGSHRGIGAGPSATLASDYSLWVTDVNNGALYLVAESQQVVSNPVLSPDGKYVAYVEGVGSDARIMVSDVSGLVSGGGQVWTTEIGLPGSDEDVECFRGAESVSWFPNGRKIAASLTVCGGGTVPRDLRIWVADLSGLLK